MEFVCASNRYPVGRLASIHGLRQWHDVLRRLRDGQAAGVWEQLHHFDSTRQRKSGILMDVHLVELLEGSGGVVTPSLSNSTQMNAYNLLGLHNQPCLIWQKPHCNGRLPQAHMADRQRRVPVLRPRPLLHHASHGPTQQDAQAVSPGTTYCRSTPSPPVSRRARAAESIPDAV